MKSLAISGLPTQTAKAVTFAGSGRHAEAAGLLGRAAAELGEIVYGEEDFPELAAEVEAAARDALGGDGFERAFEAGRVAG